MATEQQTKSPFEQPHVKGPTHQEYKNYEQSKNKMHDDHHLTFHHSMTDGYQHHNYKTFNSNVISTAVPSHCFIKFQKGNIFQKYTEGREDQAKVAVKEIPKRNVKESQIDLHRFNELEIMKKLVHPNIIQLIETWEAYQTFYIVMEYLPGQDLYQYLTSCEFDIKHVRLFADTMLSAIEYLHSHHVIHRDIKPENIILKEEGNLEKSVLVDFGLAKLVKSSTQMLNQPHGTILYMAPQVLNGSYNEKCDIWSLGVIIYMMAMGELPPFYDQYEKQLARQISCLQSIVIPQIHLDKWLSLAEQTRNFILKLLQVDPDKRYSAKQAKDDPFIAKFKAKQLKKIQKKSKKDPSKLFKIPQQLIKFKDYNKLRRLAMHYIAKNLEPSKIKEIEDEFCKIDTHKTGYISQESITKLIKQCCPSIDSDVLHKIIRKIDMNKDGKIDIRQFISACQQAVYTPNDYQIESAFKFFDNDQDGKISSQDLMNFLKEFRVEEIGEIMRQCDTNKDGLIDFKEFKDMMQLGVKKDEEKRFQRLQTMLDQH